MAFCGYLKQSTAIDLALGPFIDDTDGKTAETALTLTQPDIRLKKGGGAWAQKNASQTLSHEEAGYYEVALDTTDTNTLGQLVVAVHESGALPVRQDYLVITAEAWDIMHGATPLAGIADAVASITVTDYLATDGSLGQALNTLIFSVNMQFGACGSTGNTTTTAHLLAAGSVDDMFNEHAVVFFDVSGGYLPAIRWITDYVGSTELATLHEALPFTPASGDPYYILTARRDVNAQHINKVRILGDGSGTPFYV